MWTKKVTELGLGMMTKEARKERLDQIFDGVMFDGPAFADLIDECRATVGVFASESTDGELMLEMLKGMDGKAFVASSDPEDLLRWVTAMKAVG